MKQIDRIKMLTDMLVENVERLEDYPNIESEYEAGLEKHIKECRENNYHTSYCVPYPICGTSRSHIEEIARLLRKELLKL